MRSAVEVSDSAVEEMLESSLEHAFEDMSARQFTEAKLKAEDLLAAVQMGLVKLGDMVPEEQRAEIERLVAAVEEGVRARSTPALKKAIEALDVGTEHLAALLVEQAMR
jgi:molecular chaperone DnaK